LKSNSVSFAPKLVERKRPAATSTATATGEGRATPREFKPKLNKARHERVSSRERPIQFAFEETGLKDSDIAATGDTAAIQTASSNNSSSIGGSMEITPEDNKKSSILEATMTRRNVFEGVRQPPITLPFSTICKSTDSIVESEQLTREKEMEYENAALRNIFRDSRESTRGDELLFLQLPSSLPINLEKLRAEREKREMEELKRRQAAELSRINDNTKGAGDSIAKSRQLAAQKEQERQLKQKQESEQKGKSSSVDDEENIWTIPFDNTLTSIPNGYIGEMVVHKSGRTRLKLGTVWFDVVPGSDFSFMEHVAAVAPNKGATYILGDVAKRVMCIPDLERTLYDAKKNPLPVLLPQTGTVKGKSPASSSTSIKSPMKTPVL